MSMRHAPTLALIACLSGCSALADLKIPVAATAKAAGTMRVPEKAAPTDKAPPQQTVTTTVVANAGLVAKTKLRIPEDFGVTLPATLVGEAGNSIVSNDGNSIVSNDGNSLRALMAAPQVHFNAGGVVRAYAEMYESSRKGANVLLALAKANEEDLLAGKEVPLLGIPGIGALSMNLKVLADHGELTFWAGDGATRHRFLWLSFTDEKHGQGIFHPVVTKHPMVFVTHFDLTKNQGDADAYFVRDAVFGHARLHIGVESFPAGTDDQPALKLKVGGYLHDALFLKDGAVVATANVLKNNKAAAIYGVKAPGASAFGFKDDALQDAAAGQHGLFLDESGDPTPHGLVSSAQRAAVPPDDDIAPPTFADPATAGPAPAADPADPEAPADATFADPVFRFPPLKPQ
jgi:hypothetical protein